MKNVIVICCITTLSGCLSFQSVKATAQLGEEVGRFRRALDPLPAWCQLSQEMTPAQPDECAKLDGDAQLFRSIPEKLAAWSEALRRMADDAGAPGIAGDATALARPLMGAEAARVGAALDALFKLATRSYRRQALAESVRSADPHVELLVAFGRGAVKLQLERLDTLMEANAQVRRSLPGQAPPQVAERVALVDVESRLRAERDTLRDYDRALQAFGTAHQRLAREAARLGSDDAAVYLSILDDLKGIVQK
jgi:hypothetical protein